MRIEISAPIPPPIGPAGIFEEYPSLSSTVYWIEYALGETAGA
jgi:hypothetical protein